MSVPCPFLNWACLICLPAFLFLVSYLNEYSFWMVIIMSRPAKLLKETNNILYGYPGILIQFWLHSTFFCVYLFSSELVMKVMVKYWAQLVDKILLCSLQHFSSDNSCSGQLCYLLNLCPFLSLNMGLFIEMSLTFALNQLLISLLRQVVRSLQSSHELWGELCTLNRTRIIGIINRFYFLQIIFLSTYTTNLFFLLT
jgi:hypothetical protein